MRIFLALLMLVSLLLRAQDSTKAIKSILFYQGFTHTFNKDLYRSPYVYKGFNPEVALAYERSSRKTNQRLQAGFMFGSIKTSFSPLASVKLLTLNYTCLKEIHRDKKYNLELGGRVGGTGWSVNYFPDMQVPNYARVHSYMVNFSLAPVAVLNLNFNAQNRLRVLLSAPVVTYAERPHFLDGSPRQHRVGVFNYFNPSIQVEYEHVFSRKLSIILRYQYEYMQYEKPKTLRMLNNGFSVGLRLRS